MEDILLNSFRKIISASIFSISLISCSGEEPEVYFSSNGGGSSSGGTSTGGSSVGGSGGFSSVNYFGIGIETHIPDGNTYHKKIFISDNSDKIVFLSDSDLVTNSNPDGVTQAFSQSAGGTLTQITQLTSATGGIPYLYPESSSYALSGDGSTIVWYGTTDPLGTNAGRASQVFISDMSGNTTQLTDTTSTVYGVAISTFAATVAFISDDDFIGTNPDNFLQLFTINTSTLAISQLTTSTTSTKGPSKVEISGDGSTIVFVSKDDNQYDQIYTINIDGSDFKQITTRGTVSSTGGLESTAAHINFDGSIIAFNSHENYTGDNGNNLSQIFSYETATSTFHKITDNWISPNHHNFDISGDNIVYIVAGGSGGIGLLSSKAVPTATSTETIVFSTAQNYGSPNGLGGAIDISYPVISERDKIAFSSSLNFGLTDDTEDDEQIYSENLLIL